MLVKWPECLNLPFGFGLSNHAPYATLTFKVLKYGTLLGICHGARCGIGAGAGRAAIPQKDAPKRVS